MDVSQVINLGIWSADVLPDLIRKYTALHQVLSHNATQQQKQPVREVHRTLLQALEQMSFDQLTNEEVDLLNDLDALQYLGKQGAQAVTDMITMSDFDPASAAADLQIAIERLQTANQDISAAKGALQKLDLELMPDEMVQMELPQIRVRFKDEASVDDVSRLKKWTADWYDIARGAAMSVGEPPQSVKVVGASNGSVIVTLTAVASVTIVLAIIAKNAGRVASEVLSIANDIEDFRHKKRLNKIIEGELKRQQTDVQNTGTEDTIAEIKSAVSLPINNETEAVLRKSVSKYFDFYAKGGDVDFIPPRHLPEPDEENEDEALIAEIAVQAQENDRLIGVIEAVRTQQAEILQLINRQDDTTNNGLETDE
jgi:hypothetical protein